jgi:hypothetical protein
MNNWQKQANYLYQTNLEKQAFGPLIAGAMRMAASRAPGMSRMLSNTMSRARTFLASDRGKSMLQTAGKVHTGLGHVSTLAEGVGRIRNMMKSPPPAHNPVTQPAMQPRLNMNSSSMFR